MARPIRISDRHIGDGHPCFIIAEAGVNHDGDPAVAKLLVDAALDAGADAVKFQTFTADDLAVPTAPKADYQMATTDAGESQLDMLRKLQLGDDDFRTLNEYCEERGIIFLSSPFGLRAVGLLDEIGVPAFKVPSGEITNISLLQCIARTKKPILLSTGMANLLEVGTAIEAMRKEGASEISVLHCVSNYPADPRDANLKAMETMAKKFGVPVGFSDHTLGMEIAFAAAALGARVLEKHLTLDTNRLGPDHAASLSPVDFSKMVRGVRMIESALGDGRKVPVASEHAVAAVARKSLVASMDIPAGTIITDRMMVARRPGNGISPVNKGKVLGRTAQRDIAKDALFTLDMLA